VGLGVVAGTNLYLPEGKTGILVDPDTGEPLPGAPGEGIFGTICAEADGVCNELDKINDLNKTDVIGGNKFISSSFEYRFPISETLGLQGVAFFDTGNAFAEGDLLFDVTDWRYGTGVGVQWFSPFGPLAVILGFPLDRLSVEDSPVFEFSVGGRDF
jgi:hypothetical protein